MKKLAFFIGIPGSGKSTYAEKLKGQGYNIICPDQIRKELFGNINEQKNADVVFSLAKERIKNSTTNVVFDATNCKWKRNLQFLKDVDAQVIFYIFMDSKDKEKCFSRIQKDLKNKIDRSNVPEHVVDNMYANFMETLKIISSEPIKSKYNFIYV